MNSSFYGIFRTLHEEFHKNAAKVPQNFRKNSAKIPQEFQSHLVSPVFKNSDKNS